MVYVTVAHGSSRGGGGYCWAETVTQQSTAITTSTITVTLSINVPDTCCPNLWKASKHKVPYVIKHMECHGRIHTGITIADRAKDERGEHHRHGPKRWVTPPMPEHKHERSDQVCQCQPSPCPVSPGLLRQLPLQNAPKGQFFGAEAEVHRSGFPLVARFRTMFRTA